MMKTNTILAAGFSLILGLLAACQVPVPGSSAAPVVSVPGKAAVNLQIKSNGFRFAPSSSVQNGRFIIPPTAEVGSWTAVLTSASGTVVNATDAGIPALIPGVWTIAVTLKNTLGQTVGSKSVTVTLVAGANTVPIVITPTQNGTGSIDVTYDLTAVTTPWDSYAFHLYKLSSGGEGADLVTVSDYSLSGSQIHFLKTLNSGSYRLVFQLAYSGTGVAPVGPFHPSITATAVVYDNVVSVIASYPVQNAQLNHAPDVVTGLQVAVSQGYPTLTWDANPTTATSYTVKRDGQVLSSNLLASTTSYMDTNYLMGMGVSYEVFGSNVYGAADPTPIPFQSVSTIAVSNPSISLGVGTTNSTTVADVQPSFANDKTVYWASTEPQVAQVDITTGAIQAFNAGTFDVAATSVENYQQTGSKTMTVEAMVTTLAGVAGVFGSNTGLPGKFSSPVAVGYNPHDGYVYTIDNNCAIRRIAADGTVTAVANTGATIPNAAKSMVFRANGDFFFTAVNSYAIYLATYNSGTDDYAVTLFAGADGTMGDVGGTVTAARFNLPNGLALDKGETTLFIADSGNNKIKIVDLAKGNNISTLAGSGASGGADGGLSTSTFNQPTGVAIDNTNEILYVSCLGGYTIRAVDSTANSVSTVAGYDGHQSLIDGTGSNTRLLGPLGLAIDGTVLYVADSGNRIRALDLSSGIAANYTLGTVAGGMGGDGDGLGLTQAGFNGAQTLAVGQGNLYTTSTYSHTIRKIQLSVFDSIAPNDAGFGTLPYNFISSYLSPGDGTTGSVRNGTIILYTTYDSTSAENHTGKMRISGIESDAGVWTLHFSWTTWNKGGTVVNRGDNAVLHSAPYSFNYFDFDNGVETSSSVDGDFYLLGTDASNRLFTPAANTVTAGIYGEAF